MGHKEHGRRSRSLMEHLLAYARDEGLAKIESMVRDLGFFIAPDPANRPCGGWKSGFRKG